MFGRICNPTVSNIGIYNPANYYLSRLFIALQMLIFYTGGLQIRQNLLSDGTKLNNEGRYANADFEVWDLVPRNVLKDKGGDIFIIDAEIKMK